ncbi:MAG: hypothetical protein KC442_09950, partial [Thermomicrobiales bacterium]|nr:hypothetical protein [Thermomicrobiales bacterium]
GPGGVGKTRLAGDIARRLGPRFPGGVLFLRLDGLRDTALVIPTIAAALNVPAAGDGRATRQRIAAQLSAQERLLILDNMEHLLAAASDLSHVVKLMTGGCLLITSRETMRISAEQVIPIGPLPRPDAGAWQTLSAPAAIDNPAVELFVRRALAHGADLPLQISSEAGRTNLAAIAEVCQRLDGLPLAIELAAAQIPLFSPQAICTMLDQAGLPLLTGGPRDQPARLQTMEASIAWSYGELADAEQHAFRALAVFAGGFSLAAAAAVLASGEPDAAMRIDPRHLYACSDPAVLGVISSLTRKHLLAPDNDVPAPAAPRFRLLEPLRLFALSRLRAAGEEPPTRLRHARYFTELATVLDPLTIGAETELRLAQQKADLDNFRAALDWALAAGEGDLVVRTTGNVAQFWKLRGHLPEARRRLAAALGVDDQSSATDRWFLRFWAITFAIEVGDHAGALALAQELLQIGQEAGDRLGEGVGYAMLSRTLGEGPARHAEAAALAQRAVEILEPLGRAEWTGLAWLRLGVERHRAGERLAARDALLRALELRRAEPFAGVVAAALISLGAVWFDLNEAQAALEAYREALHLAMEEENQTALLGAILGLADVARWFSEGTAKERMTTSLQLAAAAEHHRLRHGLGREAIHVAMAGWTAPLRETFGDQAIDAHLAAAMALDQREIMALATGLRIAAPAPQSAPPPVPLIESFGSLQ